MKAKYKFKGWKMGIFKEGYDFTSLSQPGEFSLKTTNEKIYGLNETKKEVKTIGVHNQTC